MRAAGIAVEVFCDCNHRQSVHHVHRVFDGHGDLGNFRAGCGLLGYSCVQYTQDAQRRRQDAGTARLLADLRDVR